jgi:phosphatidylserine/phosphatidylglycerophosphate/cardiolipin synthase-like enzyme
MTVMAMVAGASAWAGEQSARPKVCFSPEGHCAGYLIEAIASATASIRVQAYSFTARDIAEALIAASKRGVDVEVIVDKSQTSERYSVLADLSEAHVPVFIDYCCAIAHNKVMIIDNHRLITGSYNYTKAAEAKNAENLLMLDDAELAKAYLDNWNEHRLGAEKLALR